MSHFSSISTLPSEILVTIFTKLPIKSLCSCIRVCKTWRTIIHHPHFTKLHFSTTTPALILHTQTYSPSGSLFTNLYFLQHQTCNNLHTTFTTLPKFDVVGSCNGILCVSKLNTWDSFCLCNPLTGDYLFLSEKASLEHDGDWEIVSGFGFDEKINKFKVIRMRYIVVKNPVTNLSLYRLVGEIITVGCGGWRSIVGGVCYPLRPRCSQTLVNGAMHWLMNENAIGMDSSQLIISLKIDDEKFVPVPPLVELDLQHGFKLELGVLEGDLCKFDYLSDDRIDIWMMLDYGVEDSWIKKVTLNVELGSYLLKPVCAVDNGEILLVYDGYTLVSFDPVTQSFRDIMVYGLPPRIGFHSKLTGIIHVGTLVSLHNALEDMKRFGLSERSEKLTLSSSCVSC